nr:TPA_asm: hypothetical protein [Polynigra virus 2]
MNDVHLMQGLPQVDIPSRCCFYTQSEFNMLTNDITDKFRDVADNIFSSNISKYFSQNLKTMTTYSEPLIFIPSYASKTSDRDLLAVSEFMSFTLIKYLNLWAELAWSMKYQQISNKERRITGKIITVKPGRGMPLEATFLSNSFKKDVCTKQYVFADYTFIYILNKSKTDVENILRNYDMVLTCEQLKFFFDREMLAVAGTTLLQPIHYRTILFDGVPGCNKTSQIIDNSVADDIILTCTRSNKQQIEARLLTRYGAKSKPTVRTIDSALYNPPKTTPKTRIFFDEVFMAHFGEIIMTQNIIKAVEFFGFGDTKQIPWISFISNLTPYHSRFSTSSIVPMRVTTRCPIDVTNILRSVYGSFETTSGVKNSITVVNDVVVPPNLTSKDAVITFTQDEKKTVQNNLRSTKAAVVTVAEAQGSTYDNVHIVRTNTVNITIFNKLDGNINPHQLVAISRHTKSLTYHTKCYGDDLTTILKNFKNDNVTPDKAKALLDQQMRDVRLAVKGATISQTTSDGDLHRYSSTSDVINAFVDIVREIRFETFVELCCGSCYLSDALINLGKTCLMVSDINQSTVPVDHVKRFLQADNRKIKIPTCDVIVINPPFGHHNENNMNVPLEIIENAFKSDRHTIILWLFPTQRVDAVTKLIRQKCPNFTNYHQHDFQMTLFRSANHHRFEERPLAVSWIISGTNYSVLTPKQSVCTINRQRIFDNIVAPADDHIRAVEYTNLNRERQTLAPIASWIVQCGDDLGITRGIKWFTPSKCNVCNHWARTIACRCGNILHATHYNDRINIIAHNYMVSFCLDDRLMTNVAIQTILTQRQYALQSAHSTILSTDLDDDVDNRKLICVSCRTVSQAFFCTTCRNQRKSLVGITNEMHICNYALLHHPELNVPTCEIRQPVVRDNNNQWLRELDTIVSKDIQIDQSRVRDVTINNDGTFLTIQYGTSLLHLAHLKTNLIDLWDTLQSLPWTPPPKPFIRQQLNYGCAYAYTSNDFPDRNPTDWMDELMRIASDATSLVTNTPTRFNQILFNRYVNGAVGIPFHKDNEKALGRNPTVASLSVGASRNFTISDTDQRNRQRDYVYRVATRTDILSIMTGTFHSTHFHGVPATRKDIGERFNITFRVVLNPDDTPREPLTPVPSDVKINNISNNDNENAGPITDDELRRLCATVRGRTPTTVINVDNDHQQPNIRVLPDNTHSTTFVDTQPKPQHTQVPITVEPIPSRVEPNDYFRMHQATDIIPEYENFIIHQPSTDCTTLNLPNDLAGRIQSLDNYVVSNRRQHPMPIIPWYNNCCAHISVLNALCASDGFVSYININSSIVELQPLVRYVNFLCFNTLHPNHRNSRTINYLIKHYHLIAGCTTSTAIHNTITNLVNYIVNGGKLTNYQPPSDSIINTTTIGTPQANVVACNLTLKTFTYCANAVVPMISNDHDDTVTAFTDAFCPTSDYFLAFDRSPEFIIQDSHERKHLTMHDGNIIITILNMTRESVHFVIGNLRPRAGVCVVPNHLFNVVNNPIDDVPYTIDSINAFYQVEKQAPTTYITCDFYPLETSNSTPINNAYEQFITFATNVMQRHALPPIIKALVATNRDLNIVTRANITNDHIVDLYYRTYLMREYIKMTNKNVTDKALDAWCYDHPYDHSSDEPPLIPCFSINLEHTIVSTFNLDPTAYSRRFTELSGLCGIEVVYNNRQKRFKFDHKLIDIEPIPLPDEEATVAEASIFIQCIAYGEYRGHSMGFNTTFINKCLDIDVDATEVFSSVVSSRSNRFKMRHAIIRNINDNVFLPPLSINDVQCNDHTYLINPPFTSTLINQARKIVDELTTSRAIMLLPNWMDNVDIQHIISRATTLTLRAGDYVLDDARTRVKPNVDMLFVTINIDDTVFEDLRLLLCPSRPVLTIENIDDSDDDGTNDDITYLPYTTVDQPTIDTSNNDTTNEATTNDDTTTIDDNLTNVIDDTHIDEITNVDEDINDDLNPRLVAFDNDDEDGDTTTEVAAESDNTSIAIHATHINEDARDVTTTLCLLNRPAPHHGLRNLSGDCYLNTYISALFTTPTAYNALCSYAAMLTSDELNNAITLITELINGTTTSVPSAVVTSNDKFLATNHKHVETSELTDVHLKFTQRLPENLRKPFIHDVITTTTCPAGHTDSNTSHERTIFVNITDNNFETVTSKHEVDLEYNCDRCHREVNGKQSTTLDFCNNQMLLIHLNPYIVGYGRVEHHYTYRELEIHRDDDFETCYQLVGKAIWMGDTVATGHWMYANQRETAGGILYTLYNDSTVLNITHDEYHRIPPGTLIYERVYRVRISDKKRPTAVVPSFVDDVVSTTNVRKPNRRNTNVVFGDNIRIFNYNIDDDYHTPPVVRDDVRQASLDTLDSNADIIHYIRNYRNNQWPSLSALAEHWQNNNNDAALKKAYGSGAVAKVITISQLFHDDYTSVHGEFNPTDIAAIDIGSAPGFCLNYLAGIYGTVDSVNCEALKPMHPDFSELSNVTYYDYDLSTPTPLYLENYDLVFSDIACKGTNLTDDPHALNQKFLWIIDQWFESISNGHQSSFAMKLFIDDGFDDLAKVNINRVNNTNMTLEFVKSKYTNPYNTEVFVYISNIVNNDVPTQPSAYYRDFYTRFLRTRLSELVANDELIQRYQPYVLPKVVDNTPTTPYDDITHIELLNTIVANRDFIDEWLKKLNSVDQRLYLTRHLGWFSDPINSPLIRKPAFILPPSESKLCSDDEDYISYYTNNIHTNHPNVVVEVFRKHITVNGRKIQTNAALLATVTANDVQFIINLYIRDYFRDVLGNNVGIIHTLSNWITTNYNVPYVHNLNIPKVHIDPMNTIVYTTWNAIEQSDNIVVRRPKLLQSGILQPNLTSDNARIITTFLSADYDTFVILPENKLNFIDNLPHIRRQRIPNRFVVVNSPTFVEQPINTTDSYFIIVHSNDPNKKFTELANILNNDPNDVITDNVTTSGNTIAVTPAPTITIPILLGSDASNTNDVLRDLLINHNGTIRDATVLNRVTTTMRQLSITKLYEIIKANTYNNIIINEFCWARSIAHCILHNYPTYRCDFRSANDITCLAVLYTCVRRNYVIPLGAPLCIATFIHTSSLSINDNHLHFDQTGFNNHNNALLGWIRITADNVDINTPNIYLNTIDVINGHSEFVVSNDEDTNANCYRIIRQSEVFTGKPTTLPTQHHFSTNALTKILRCIRLNITQPTSAFIPTFSITDPFSAFNKREAYVQMLFKLLIRLTAYDVDVAKRWFDEHHSVFVGDIQNILYIHGTLKSYVDWDYNHFVNIMQECVVLNDLHTSQSVCSVVSNIIRTTIGGLVASINRIFAKLKLSDLDQPSLLGRNIVHYNIPTYRTKNGYTLTWAAFYRLCVDETYYRYPVFIPKLPLRCRTKAVYHIKDIITLDLSHGNKINYFSSFLTDADGVRRHQSIQDKRRDFVVINDVTLGGWRFKSDGVIRQGYNGCYEVIDRVIESTPHHFISPNRHLVYLKCRQQEGAADFIEYRNVYAFPTFKETVITARSDNYNLNVLQTAYNNCMPTVGNFLCNAIYDKLSMERNDIEADVEDTSIIGSKVFKAARAKIIYFEPKLRTGRGVRRDNSSKETIIGLTKRNFNINFMQKSVNLPQLLEVGWNRLCSSFFRRGADTMVRNYQQNPIVSRTAAAREWVGLLENRKLRLLNSDENVGKLLETQPLSLYSMAIKTVTKDTCSNKLQTEYDKVQTIMSHAPAVTSIYSPVFKDLTKRFLSLLRPEVILNVGYDENDLSRVIDHCSTHGYPCTRNLELDFASFDKSQQRVCHEIKMFVYEKLGMDQRLLYLWDQCHEYTFNISYAAGIACSLAFQTKSGDASTTIGNTIINMFTTAYVIQPHGFAYALFLGDDNYISIADCAVTEAHCRMFSEVFNIEAKLVVQDHGYFCGRFIVTTPRGTRIMPDPVKRIEKLSTYGIRSHEHLEDNFESFRDLCSSYNDIYFNEELATLVNKRYATKFVSADVMNVLFSYSRSKTRYLSLFTFNRDHPEIKSMLRRFNTAKSNEKSDDTFLFATTDSKAVADTLF